MGYKNYNFVEPADCGFGISDVAEIEVTASHIGALEGGQEILVEQLLWPEWGQKPRSRAWR